MSESQEADTNPSVNARSALTLPPWEPMGRAPRPLSCQAKMRPCASPEITSPCRLARAVTRGEGDTEPAEAVVLEGELSGPLQVRLEPLTAHHRRGPSPTDSRNKGHL